jgi:hypothetical protein
MSNHFKSNFTFGAITAESDHLLSVSYLDNGDYEAIESRDDKRCFIVGRTGSGKSAAFKHLMERHPAKVVSIDPESLSLPYILNLDIIRKLVEMGVHIDPFMKTLWKHVMVVEILRHRYRIDTPEQKIHVLQSLKEKLKRDPAKIKALEYLDKFGDKFWCETEERIKQIADTFVQKMSRTGKLGASVPGLTIEGSGSVENTVTQGATQEITDKYQKIVNEMQLPQLNYMLTVLNNQILESPQHFTYLVIDDLDKEWIDEDLAILLIKSLFQAVVDMQRIQYLKILVALRTNIFNQLNYGKQTRGGQEEKFRGLSLDLRWTQNDLQLLLDVRAKAASEYHRIDPPKSLSEMLPRMKNKRAENPITYIIERTLMRPRDAILFLNHCVREATGKKGITWENIHSAEKKYSQDRLLALRDEWKDPYKGIEKALNVFRGRNSILGINEITNIFDDIACLLGDQEFSEEGNWLNKICQPIFAENDNWDESYRGIIEVLYKISFIGIIKNKNQKAIYSYIDHDLIHILEPLRENTLFEIHIAFRHALNIKEVKI